MTIKELIKLLQKFDQDLLVLTTIPDGDYDEVAGAGVMKVRHVGYSPLMSGEYEEFDEAHSRLKPLGRFKEHMPGQPFDALVIK